MKYKAIVHNLRTDVQNEFPEINAGDIDEVQRRLTQGYAHLLKSMLEEAFRLMGNPPCTFAWVGAGSFSRGEVLPYSDAEYLWLFEAESLEIRRYFWAVDRLIVAQIHSIDEPLGLHPDQYMEVTSDEVMKVNLPDNMCIIINRFNTKCRRPEGVYTEIVSNLQGCLIAGEETLWLEYLRQVKTCNPLQDIFHKLLLVSVENYDKTWSKEGKNPQSQLDVKEGYGYFLTYLAVMLKFYHDVEGNSTQEIWQTLIDTQKINPTVGKDLAIASQEIQSLRCRMHFFYRESRQDIDISQSEDGKIYGLSDKEQQTLSNIQKLIQQVYRHLGAIRKIETLTKGDKSKNATVTLFSADMMETFLPCIEAYESLSPVLMIPRLEANGLQSLLKRLLDTPEYLLQPAGWRGFEFLLRHGAKSNIPNSVGITPLRMVLAWSEGYPDLAERVWKQLLPAEGNLEERNIHTHATLLSQAMTENKHLSVIVLCRLGAGRTESAEVLLQYIRTRLSAPEVPAAQKKDLQSVLPLLMQQNPLLGWYLALETVRIENLPTSPGKKAKNRITVEGVQTTAGILNPVMAHTLFTDKNTVQAVNTYGRHQVAKCMLNPIISVYAKFYPELPGIEEAVKSLALQLSHSSIIPYSELFCFKEAQTAYPVLLSQEIKGENLQEVLNAAYRDQKTEAQEKLKKLDPRRWTDLFILSVLIHPEDGKPDNYILTPAKNAQGEDCYALVGIDNDHALVDIYNQEKDEAKAFQVKTILYCLDLMQAPLDKQAVSTFLTKDPEQGITRWLDYLDTCQPCYEALFSVELRETLLKKEESIPQIVLPPKSIPKLYERWMRLKKALTKNPNTTAMDLLIQADPLVGIRYQVVFAQHAHPLDRFHAIAAPAYSFTLKIGYYKTLVTSSQLLKSHAISTQLLLTTQQYGPQEAKKEFYQALYQRQGIEEFAHRLSAGDIESFKQIALISVKEAVLKKTDFKNVTPKLQTHFIKDCLDKKEGLMALQRLSLINLEQIGAKQLKKLLIKSPNLQSLYLARLSKIENVEFLQKSNISLRLRTLVLQHLESLTTIALEVPQLKYLILGDLPQCQQLSFPETKSLKQIKIDNCPAISFKQHIYTLIENNLSLRFNVCDILNQPDISEWMAMSVERAGIEAELWSISNKIKALNIETLNLFFPTLLISDIMGQLAILIYNTLLKQVTIQDNSGKSYQIPINSLQSLAGKFNLEINAFSYRLNFKRKEDATLLKQILEGIAITVPLEAHPGATQLNIQKDNVSPRFLGFLYALKPQQIYWLQAIRLLQSLISIKLVIIGPACVGKSCLALQFISEVFVETTYPTMEDSYRKLLNCDGQEVILNIYDTAGIKDWASVRDIYIEIGQVFIVCFPITRRSSFDEVPYLRTRIINLTDNEDMPVVLVGMMCDLEEDREVPTDIGQNLAKDYGWSYLEASAKTGHNVVAVFEEAVRLFRKRNYGKDDLSSLRTRTMLQDLTLPLNFLYFLFHFLPRLQVLQMESLDKELLELALTQTQGCLEELRIGEQVSFDMAGLRLLKQRIMMTPEKQAVTISLNKSSLIVEEHTKLLISLRQFLHYIFPEAQIISLPDQMCCEIKSTDDALLKEVLEIAEALKTWASLQPEISLTANNTSEGKPPLIIEHPLPALPILKSPKSKKTSAKPRRKLQKEKLENLLPVRPVRKPKLKPLKVSLFTHTLPYLEMFKPYRETLLKFIQGKRDIPLEIFLGNLLSSAKRPLERAVLLEALEWNAVKLKEDEVPLQRCADEIDIAQKINAIGKKTDKIEALLPVLRQYQAYLKNLVQQGASPEETLMCKQEHDLCLILYTALLAKQQSGKKWDSKVFFKELTEKDVCHACGQVLYDPALGCLKNVKSLSIKTLWKVLQASAIQRLPLDILQKEKEVTENQYHSKIKAYQAILKYWQTQLNLIPQQRWKLHYLYNKNAQMASVTVHRFGGKRGISIHSFFHLNRSLEIKRFHIEEALCLSSLLGSTYFSSDKPLDVEETLCLDANYQQGETGATADGYGHFASAEENRKVHQAAYRTVKLMTRYAAGYPDADSLIADIPQLFIHVGKAVKYSFLHAEEAGMASCVLTRAFPVEKGVRIVAAGIGDSLVAVFDPETGIFQTLIMPRQYHRGGQFTPLSITEKLAEGRVQCQECYVSAKAIVFRMTDGAWEALPHCVSLPCQEAEGQHTYLSYRLEDEKLAAMLIAVIKENPDATAGHYRQCLQNTIQHTIEARKEILIQQQRELQEYLQQFHAAYSQANPSMKDFLGWGEQQGQEIPQMVLSFLKYLNIDPAQLADKPLSSLEELMKHIHLGDDITLHVESVSGMNVFLSEQILSSLLI